MVMVTTTDAQPSESQTVNTRRRGQITAPVKPPLSEIRLSTFLYVIGFLALLYSLWFGYTMTGLKLQGAKNLKENIQGKDDTDQPVQQIVVENPGEGSTNVEAKIAELAGLLGVPAVPFASAVADAIKPYIPEASSSSLSDAIKETNSILSAFVEAMEHSPITSTEESEATVAFSPGAAKAAEAAKSVFAAVGFDDGEVDDM